jgi:hypothetical protein
MTTMRWLPVLGLALAACTPANIARQASSAAVDEGAEELTEASTQKSLQKAAADPQIQAATQDMTQHITEGILQAMESERGRAQITQMTRTVTLAAVQQMAATLGSEQTRAHLTGLTEGVTDAALKQVGESLQSDLRPALRTMLQEDLTHGLATALRSEELQPALGQTAKNVAYNLALGANDGLGDAWDSDRGIAQDARMLPQMLPGVNGSWLWLGLAGMGMLTLMFVSGAVMLIARARQARAEVSRLESATLLLATAMRERQATDQTDEILAVVQQALEGRAEKTGKHRIMDALRMRKSG